MSRLFLTKILNVKYNTSQTNYVGGFQRKMVKNLILLFVFVLLGVYAAHSQDAEEKTIVSDEFHFAASFPAPPTQSRNEISTKFGKGFATRWTLELKDISYEVLVADFPYLSVKMDYKPLNLFYDTICNDLSEQYGAKFGYHTDVLFDEYGRAAGRIAKEKSVNVRMYLVRQRLYLVSIIMSNSLLNKGGSIIDEQTKLDFINFLDGFIFIYKKENEKKYSFGLPQTASQNLKSQ